MNSIKKGLLTLGATAALTGAFIANNTTNVEAAGWEARTVEEVKEDVQSNGVETRYTIQWGDTLGTISKSLDISIDQIADMNEIANRDLIIAGNTLHLSTESNTVSVEDSVTHEVESFEIEEPVEEETTEPVEETQEAPAEEAPAEEPEEAPVEESAENTTTETATTGSEAEAKEWIAQRESNGSYTAYNSAGGYYGRYQLNPSLIDYGASPEEQEEAANNYVAERYGSWTAAQAFWQENGWY